MEKMGENCWSKVIKADRLSWYGHKECNHTPSPLNSVTRWLDYFSLFGYLQQLKIVQKIAKVGSKFC